MAGISANAQTTSTHPLTPADKVVLQHYTLTEEGYQRLMATAKDAAANHISMNVLDATGQSLDQTAENLDARPGVHTLLARHDLTARQFLLGEYSLIGAGMAVKYAGHPGIDTARVNPANVALYRRHEAELQGPPQPEVAN
jgi:hypothetical protein